MIEVILILSVMKASTVTHEFTYDMEGKDFPSCHRMGFNSSNELTKIFKSRKMTVTYECKERKRV
jgi:hypothetical protein